MPLSRYLVLAVVTVLVVPAVHAARRRTSLVNTYAVLAALTFAAWTIPHGVATSIADLPLGVTSTLFYGAVLGGVFLLYVVDGPRAGRMGAVVVVGVGLLYAALAALFDFLTPLGEVQFLRLDGPRACAASLVASVIAVILLGITWESSRRSQSPTALLVTVFVVLLVVLEGDALVYFALAWSGRPGFLPAFEGALISRLALAVLYAPIFTAYIGHEVRRHGLKLAARPVLAIVTREDLERELASARHNLRLGTEALWMSEEQYRRMVDDIPMLVCRFSRDGVVTHANRAFCNHVHQQLNDVLGTPVLGRFAPHDREQASSSVRALTPRQPTVKLALRTISPPTAQRTERWVVRGVFTPDGVSVAFQAIGSDVTRELELEASAEQASRLEAIAQLAGGLAHDLNNLMSVIDSSAELARNALGDGAPGAMPVAREAVEDISCAAERVIALTRQLRAISRKEPVTPTRVDLSGVVETMTPLVRRLLAGPIRLELDLARGLPATVVDPSQLERVVVNLVVNARDAMGERGVVNVSTRGVTLDGDAATLHPGARAGEYVVLTVSDNGRGIDETVMKRIFEPFFTTRAQAGGTGLGLATVHGIVQQAGGFVLVESTPGAGTTFRVHLPTVGDASIEPS